MIIRSIKEGDGVAYVLLPGYMLDAWSLDKLASKLSNCKVLIVKHSTNNAIVDPVLWAEELSNILSSMGVEKFYLIGYSMGGWLAQYYTQLYSWRVEGLILCGTCWPNDYSRFSSESWIDFLDYLYSLDRQTFFRVSLWNSLSCMSKSDQIYLDEIQSLMNSNFPKYRDCLYQIKLMEALINHDLAVRFDKKILVLYSNNDLVMPPIASRNLTKYYPSYHSYCIEGGHLFVHEYAAQCSVIIEEWVDNVCIT